MNRYRFISSQSLPERFIMLYEDICIGSRWRVKPPNSNFHPEFLTITGMVEHSESPIKLAFTVAEEPAGTYYWPNMWKTIYEPV